LFRFALLLSSLFLYAIFALSEPMTEHYIVMLRHASCGQWHPADSTPAVKQDGRKVELGFALLTL
jgi:hypothetical protein